MPTTEAGQVLVIGSVNEDIALRVDRLPGPGSTVLSSSMHVGAGGKGANQAVAASRAGARVALLARFGDDARGASLRLRLARENIDLTVSREASGESSGLALITVDERGDNSIVVFPGANSSLSPAAVVNAVGALEPDDVVLIQCEIPAASVDAAVDTAHAAGIRVVLNLAPFRLHPLDTLSRVHILVVNEPEARELVDALNLGGGSASTDLAEQLSGALGTTCIVTLGASGSVMTSPHGSSAVDARRPDRVVDTTGAGDAYVGVLAGSIASGVPVPDAMAIATVAASLSVERPGAIDSYPTSDELAAHPTSPQPAG